MFHGEHLITADTHESAMMGVSQLCSRLLEANRDINNLQVIVPLACELYMNMASMQYKAWGQEDKAQDLVKEGLEGYSLAVNILKDAKQDPETGEMEMHHALMVSINDNEKSPLDATATENGTKEPEVFAKGIVMISFDEILPAHFAYLLQEHTNITIQEEGVTTILVAHANEDVTLIPVTNAQILEQVNEYKKAREAQDVN